MPSSGWYQQSTMGSCHFLQFQSRSVSTWLCPCRASSVACHCCRPLPMSSLTPRLMLDSNTASSAGCDMSQSLGRGTPFDTASISFGHELVWSGDVRQKGVYIYSHIFHERGLDLITTSIPKTYPHMHTQKTKARNTDRTDHICHIKDRDVGWKTDDWWPFGEVGTRKFHLPDYLKAFLARLGHEVETYVPQLGTGEQRLI